MRLKNRYTILSLSVSVDYLFSRSSEKRRNDKRTRTARYANLYASWAMQTSELANAYLSWKHTRSTSVPTNSASLHAFQITAVDIFSTFSFFSFHLPPLDLVVGFDSERAIQQQDNELANVLLLRSGLLGCSPISPTMAISVRCLEFYHQLRRRQSSFGIQAFAKVLCALNNVCTPSPRSSSH
jgi:hypothetical protein